MKDTEVKISKILKQLGISPDILGYKYLKEAILMVLRDDTVLHKGVTKIMYPAIAEKFNTTASRVERAIRHAAECGALRGDTEMIEEIFGYVVSMNKGKPTNSQFIACVADFIVLSNEGDAYRL